MDKPTVKKKHGPGAKHSVDFKLTDRWFGGGLCGYCDDETTYKELVEVFGEPNHGRSGDSKADVEWDIAFEDGTDARIYNYKTGPAYLGTEGRAIQQLTGSDWHIGGMGRDCAHHVRKAIEEHRRCA